MTKDSVKMLEAGNIYFLYKPKIGEFAPEGLEDIQKFYLILNPTDIHTMAGKSIGENLYRLIVVAEKKLPQADNPKKYWGYVESIAKSAKAVEEEFKGRVYSTKTVGERGQPSGRPAGEGVYQIFKHKDHTHFVYELALPEQLGPVQTELGIKREGNFIISLINPQFTPPKVDFPKFERASYPKKLQGRFGKRRFLPVESLDFLDYSGSAFLLIGVNKEISEDLGIKIESQSEDETEAKVFGDLRLEKSAHREKPLFRGRWA